MGNRSFKLELRVARLNAWLGRDVMTNMTQTITQTVAELRALGSRKRSKNVALGVLGTQAQRFGGKAWGRIAARWPALAELVREQTESRSQRRPPRAMTTGVPASSEAVDALIAQLMGASAWHTRASAALSLAPVMAEGVVPALVRALRDQSVEVAVAAAEALSSQQDELALAELLLVLENRDGYFSPVTRVAAITGLARRLDVARFDPVFAALRDIDAEVSIAAVAVIADRIPNKTSSLLLPVLCDKSGYYLPLVRLAVANALERTGALHEGVVGALLLHEHDPSVQRVLERAKYLSEPPQALP
jgi:HEAT repeat protein